MSEPRDRLPELLAVMRRRQRRKQALRGGVACAVLGAVTAIAWIVAPAPAPVRPHVPQVIASRSPIVPPVLAAPQKTTTVRIVTTEQVLASTRVEVRTIAPDGLAQTLARNAPCYSLVRLGDSQRLLYSCR